jgi:Na+/melibiose symporter-like transporter
VPTSTERLSIATKAATLGDHTLNLAPRSSLFYLFFLTEVAGIRPALASFVIFWAAHDAFTDPLMGGSRRLASRLAGAGLISCSGALGLGFAAL